jgi:hypothetical protein
METGEVTSLRSALMADMHGEMDRAIEEMLDFIKDDPDRSARVSASVTLNWTKATKRNGRKMRAKLVMPIPTKSELTRKGKLDPRYQNTVTGDTAWNLQLSLFGSER